MKKLMLMLAASLALTITVGCEESGEKVAEKMNSEADQAQALEQQGLKDLYSVDFSTALTKMSAEELTLNRSKLVSASNNFSEARKKYQHILDIENDNKDKVKIIGKDSYTDRIAKLDKWNTEINERIKELDVEVKARQRKSH